MTPFGRTAAGRDVHQITLSQGPLTARILTLGATLQDLRLSGVDHSLTLGSDRVSDYEDQMQFHGSAVGPVVNRLSRAQAPIAGQVFRFETNLDGRHCLHSGSAGTQAKIWEVTQQSEPSLTLRHQMPDGEGGFPGNRVLTARFDLSDTALRLTLTTKTDAPSLANATNHSYWNLDGSDHLRDHRLTIAADHYLPCDGLFIPTGEIAPVAGTPHDVRHPKRLFPGAPPLDNTYCVARARGPLTERLTLTGASGVTLRVATTEPGVHVYDARAAQRPGGPFYEGLAIECQGWPDAPNQAGFPGIEVHPGAPVTQVTEWRFSAGA